MLTAFDAESVYVGPAVTVSETGVALLKLPDVPVTVTVTLFPVVAVLLALSVRVLELVAGL